MRSQLIEEQKAVDAQAKTERDAEARALRAATMAKAEAKKAAELKKTKQIKKEMAKETAKAAKEAAEKEKARFDKSQTERVENVNRLKLETRLRSDAEIANERPDGSPMSKGGKAEFIAQVKAGEYDE